MLMVAACTTGPSTVPVEYQFADLPDRLGFTLSYTNQTRRMICLSPSDWSNGAGWFDTSENRIFLRVGSQRFSMKANNGGYCSGGCATRARPGETVTDFVLYARFELPPQLRSESKQLEFVPAVAGYHCAR